MPRTPLIPLPFPPLPLLVAVRRLSYSVEVDVARFIVHCMLCFQGHNIREVTLFALLSIPKNLCTLNIHCVQNTAQCLYKLFDRGG